MNTTYEIVYEKFFNRIINDKKFWITGIPAYDMKELAYKRANQLINQAVVTITTSTKYDMPIDILSSMNDDMEEFNLELNKVEIELIADVMLHEYLSGDITARLNALGKVFGEDLKVFAPANEVKEFNDTVKQLKEENNIKIINYKTRKRDTYKKFKFDFASINGG